MKYLLMLLVLCSSLVSCAQRQTYDIISYNTPAGFKREDKNNFLSFSKIDKKNWVQIALYKSNASKGSIDQDFEAEWAELVAPLGPTTVPADAVMQEMGDWKVKSGNASFTFNNAPAITSLTTISGHTICVSVVCNTNTQDFVPAMQDFLSSVELTAPSGTTKTTTPATNTTNTTQPVASTPSSAVGYGFSTTTFNDGWKSTIQEDWVEVTKGTVKVLLHYPKAGTIIPADPDPHVRNAWNILVAPRYSSMQNFKVVSPSLDWQRVYCGAANMVDKSGQSHYVVLFRRNGTWNEFICPDKNTFVQQFGVDADQVNWDTDTKIFNLMGTMDNYNKFAIAASDFKGKWTDKFSSNTFYTNIYTGLSAGMSTYSSTSWFEFGGGQQYKWELVAANSYGGVSKFAQAKGAGRFTIVNNWQIKFSDIEGKPKTYDAYFTAIKGSRVLWLNDAVHPGSGIFQGYAKE